ncbi:MAG TPA: transketolase [Candidatus Limnocylindria bacterium]|nr:transketolase [Candidatus Limnocylindria bacterium]
MREIANVSNNEQNQWRELGQQLRVDSIRSSSAAGSGHPTSSMSAADLMAVLVSKYLHYDFANPKDARNDHLIFSKGHASPLLYAIYKAVGAISDEEMLTFRQLGSRIEGHPTPVLPYVDVATGSLGQGLPISVGVAYAGKYLDRLPYRVWCLCGDSEMAEGSMWEAFEAAGFHGLDNLVAIIDVNRLGQTGETMHGWDLDAYANRARAFGWEAIEIDGHDVEQIDAALGQASNGGGRPTVIVAKTEKGHGVAAVANKNGAHGKPVPDEAEAIAELGGVRNISVQVAKPTGDGKPHAFETSGELSLPKYEIGTKEATRKAYGDALVALGNARGDVVVIDGEVGNSTYSEEFKEAHPERFVQAYIAEQQLVSYAVGFQVRGWRPFAATFAAFLSRAYDFVRMAAVSRANIVLAGSHAGVSIGEDGPSQMALEDLASLRAIHGSTVLYPSDPNQAAELLAAAADREGIVFMRTTREKTPVIYQPGERFEIGGSRVVRRSDDDAVTLIGAGVTLHEALKAADLLAEDGIAARVIDLYSVKPVDEATIRAAARETDAIVTVEDHFPEGGLGDAVLDALAEERGHAVVHKLAVRIMPGSATPAEQLEAAGIDAEHIAAAARELSRARTPTQA